jgi:hypothetical protein
MCVWHPPDHYCMTESCHRIYWNKNCALVYEFYRNRMQHRITHHCQFQSSAHWGWDVCVQLQDTKTCRVKCQTSLNVIFTAVGLQIGETLPCSWSTCIASRKRSGKCVIHLKFPSVLSAASSLPTLELDNRGLWKS